MRNIPSPEVIEMPQRVLVGQGDRYTMETRDKIPAQWEAFFAAGYDIANAVPGAMFGVSTEADGNGGFRYFVAREVSELPATLPEGTCAVTLSSGTYAVLRRFGPIFRLPQDLDWMFSDWLPASDYHQREGAVFECYPDDPRNGPDGMAYELWVPVTPR
ncbi:GyrI-like domain-containing protein [Mesobacterium sp. TK19101]|uniref:GyrI-like domain-containing protein n=1 Tax=Mesobacterium hydrothermale TaxID=3111907 RepID=A0ABU6HGA9_9RHOB|nr:GyrI-like domain-containing protein [Mesobacterium sp. TK19101]MEC3861498.1 GyrI-like domain-containing protein [Mesobacterium sp. TK19101]